MRHYCGMNKNPPLSFLQIETAANNGAFGHNSLPNPSQAQTLAGNYKLGKTNIYGLQIAIENPRNSYRTGVDPKTGKRWSNRMAAHYGYIQGTKGADGDAIDCFIGVFPQSEHAYIINQYVNGAFDEHKIMLCVPDESTAKSNYLDSYDKGWNGLHSMVKASITQLKWWLKNGNHAKPLQPSHLPYEGIETMNQQSVIWDSASNPTNTTFAKLIYDIRLADKDDLLILDSASMGDILADADEVMVLDAMVSSFGKLPRKMDMLKTVMESAGSEVKPLAVQISEPFKQGGVMQVAAVFELSDGQTISVFFHNPDVTPGKVTASDEMVSWKWLLNKKDITIVVAPEQGKDLNVRAVASRIIKLAEKNSAAFQRANAKRSENMAAIDAIKTEITDLEKQLIAKQNELDVAKVEAEDKLVADQKSQEAFKQSVLQALIDDFGWQNQSTTGGNLFWVTKTIGGGREGGVVNTNGDRRLSAKIQGKELVATHGDNALVTVPFNTDDTAVENAKRLDDAVNAIDPRYVAAVENPALDESEIDRAVADGYKEAQKIGKIPDFVPEWTTKEQVLMDAFKVGAKKWMEEQTATTTTNPELDKQNDLINKAEAEGYDTAKALRRIPSKASDWVIVYGEKNQAIIDAYMNGAKRWADEQLTISKDEAIPVPSTNPELDKQKAKLAGLIADQERMKAANKVVNSKKLTDDEKIAQLKEQGISELAAKKMLEPDYAGRVGFPSYMLTNNNATIRNTKARIDELETKEVVEQMASNGERDTSYDFDGGTIDLNYAIDRLQVFFDSRPDSEMIAKLKSNGFKWSPSNTAWQRQLTDNAIYVANRLFGTDIKTAAQAAQDDKASWADKMKQQQQQTTEPTPITEPTPENDTKQALIAELEALKSETDVVIFDSRLDEIAAKVEAAGLMEELDPELNALAEIHENMIAEIENNP